MPITPNGRIFFEDEYQQKYEVVWETINGLIDITTITQQPYVWGEKSQGKIENNILYRRGIVTVHRQAIRLLEDGYVVAAEGLVQYVDLIQMNFPCEPGPVDNFKHHLNYNVLDQTDISVANKCWADYAGDTTWCDLNSDGSPIVGVNVLEWIDVWSNT